MTDQTTTHTFDIRLGEFTASYHLYEATAPREYDGFGTISLHDHVSAGDPRWVLIRTEHENWQVSRYASGMYTPRKMDAAEFMGVHDTWITEQLYKRLGKVDDAKPAPPADDRAARLLSTIEGIVADRLSLLQDELDVIAEDAYSDAETIAELQGDVHTQMSHFAHILNEAREIAAGNGRTK